MGFVPPESVPEGTTVDELRRSISGSENFGDAQSSPDKKKVPVSVDEENSGNVEDDVYVGESNEKEVSEDDWELVPVDEVPVESSPLNSSVTPGNPADDVESDTQSKKDDVDEKNVNADDDEQKKEEDVDDDKEQEKEDEVASLPVPPRTVRGSVPQRRRAVRRIRFSIRAKRFLKRNGVTLFFVVLAMVMFSVCKEVRRQRNILPAINRRLNRQHNRLSVLETKATNFHLRLQEVESNFATLNAVDSNETADDIMNIEHTIQALMEEFEDLKTGIASTSDRASTITNSNKNEKKKKMKKHTHTYVVFPSIDQKTVDEMTQRCDGDVVGTSELAAQVFAHTRSLAGEGHGEATLRLKLIREQHSDVVRLARNIDTVSEVFVDLSCLVHEQGEMLTQIQHNVGRGRTYMKRANTHLRQALTAQKRKRKLSCCVVMICLVAAAVVFLVAFLVARAFL